MVFEIFQKKCGPHGDFTPPKTEKPVQKLQKYDFFVTFSRAARRGFGIVDDIFRRISRETKEVVVCDPSSRRSRPHVVLQPSFRTSRTRTREAEAPSDTAKARASSSKS